MRRASDAAVRLVARLPTPIRWKLVIAFGAVVGLLVASTAMGVFALGRSKARAEGLSVLQRRVSVYHQLQSDTIYKLYLGTSSLVDPSPEGLDAVARQLNQAYDFERLQYLARDEGALLDEIQTAYQRFVRIMTEAIDRADSGVTVDALQAQRTQARPVADTLVRLTDELVNRAESDIASLVRENQQAYARSRQALIAFAAGGIGLALVLGFTISLAVSGPVTKMNRRLAELGAGNFTERVVVANRDELGVLASNLNSMSAELGGLYEDLERVSRHKSEFLASMSHELRTPLNAIIGFSEVLLEQMFGPVNERQAIYLGDILASGRHLLLLINDVLDISKIEAGRMELEISTFRLADLLEGSVTIVRERADREGIELRVDVDDEMGEVEADHLKLKQVVLNLLSNAVKFTPTGGRVDLAARRLHDRIVVTVADTGVGIDEADHDRIFEQFQQAGQREGSGLGLAVARKFVMLHGGTLTVDSVVDVGSTFSFEIPFRQPATPADLSPFTETAVLRPWPTS